MSGKRCLRLITQLIIAAHCYGNVSTRIITFETHEKDPESAPDSVCLIAHQVVSGALTCGSYCQHFVNQGCQYVVFQGEEENYGDCYLLKDVTGSCPASAVTSLSALGGANALFLKVDITGLVQNTFIGGPIPDPAGGSGTTAGPSTVWGQGDCEWPNQFDCSSTGGGTCISDTQTCNGHSDCASGWDEDEGHCN